MLIPHQVLRMTTYAIGDIQGCQQRLNELLQRIYATTSNPRLIFVGDLVNRGPQSLATLREIRALGDAASVVLGNHDLHLLAVANGIRKQNRSDTLDDILNAPDRDELLDWLRRQPLAILESNHLFVHAGVLPQWSAQQTVALSQEVQAVMSGPDYADFLAQMYGNEPARWNDTLAGADRLRCIVNALTRMRFCTADGTMELKSKGIETTLSGFMPWFDVPGRKTEDVTVVAGHWSTLGLIMRPNLLTLDTGCLWGGKLTAVKLEDRSLVQVECPQYQKPGTV
jgi:bis(5'-nucleosyl)-tetraphosphatase (symmetrical)